MQRENTRSVDGDDHPRSKGVYTHLNQRRDKSSQDDDSANGGVFCILLWLAPVDNCGYIDLVYNADRMTKFEAPSSVVQPSCYLDWWELCCTK
jgi:hypothetical protein